MDSEIKKITLRYVIVLTPDSLPKEADRSAQRLRAEYDTFVDKLESESKQALDEIEDHYTSLAIDLEKKKNDFLNNGQKEIAATYDKLLQSLPDTLSRYQKQQSSTTQSLSLPRDLVDT